MLDHIFQDPGDKFRYSCADAGQIGLRTPNAPRYDAGQKVVSVTAAHLEWSARITLTGVLTAGFVAGTQKDFRYEFVAASAQEHGFATIVADDGHGNLGRKSEHFDGSLAAVAHQSLPLAARKAASRPRSVFPNPSPSHCVQSAGRPWPADKLEQCAARTPAAVPASPARDHTRT